MIVKSLSNFRCEVEKIAMRAFITVTALIAFSTGVVHSNPCEIPSTPSPCDCPPSCACPSPPCECPPPSSDSPTVTIDYDFFVQLFQQIGSYFQSTEIEVYLSWIQSYTQDQLEYIYNISSCFTVQEYLVDDFVDFTTVQTNINAAYSTLQTNNIYSVDVDLSSQTTIIEQATQSCTTALSGLSTSSSIYIGLQYCIETDITMLPLYVGMCNGIVTIQQSYYESYSQSSPPDDTVPPASPDTTVPPTSPDTTVPPTSPDTSPSCPTTPPSSPPCPTAPSSSPPSCDTPPSSPPSPTTPSSSPPSPTTPSSSPPSPTTPSSSPPSPTTPSSSPPSPTTPSSSPPSPTTPSSSPPSCDTPSPPSDCPSPSSDSPTVTIDYDFFVQLFQQIGSYFQSTEIEVYLSWIQSYTQDQLEYIYNISSCFTVQEYLVDDFVDFTTVQTNINAAYSTLQTNNIYSVDVDLSSQTSIIEQATQSCTTALSGLSTSSSIYIGLQYCIETDITMLPLYVGMCNGIVTIQQSYYESYSQTSTSETTTDVEP